MGTGQRGATIECLAVCRFGMIAGKPRLAVTSSKHPDEVAASDPVFGADGDRLVHGIVDDRQAFDRPATSNPVDDEIHRPDRVALVGSAAGAA